MNCSLADDLERVGRNLTQHFELNAGGDTYSAVRKVSTCEFSFPTGDGSSLSGHIRRDIGVGEIRSAALGNVPRWSSG